MKHKQKKLGFCDFIPHYIKIIFLLSNENVSKFIFNFYTKWWNVNTGKSITLCGLPKIRKTPGSTISIGDRCRILSKFESNSVGINRKSMLRTLNPDSIIKIGNDCGLSGVVISSAQSIIIGDRVMIGANCTITDSNSHSIDYKQRYPDYYNLRKGGWKENIYTAPIVIENDVFIGMNSIILKGVTIGKGSVIGAGSVVSKSIPTNVIAAGNPAVPLKEIN